MTSIGEDRVEESERALVPARVEPPERWNGLVYLSLDLALNGHPMALCAVFLIRYRYCQQDDSV
jgi:hypothetical protein